MKKVLVAGSVVLDIPVGLAAKSYRPINELFEQGKTTALSSATLYPGGIVGNTGMALVELDIPTCLYAKIGADIPGELLTSMVFQANVTGEFAIEKDYPTSVTIAFTPIGMDKISLFLKGASQHLFAEDIPIDFLNDADLFHFGYPTTMECLYKNEGTELKALLKRAKETGITCSMDTALPGMDTNASYVAWRPILKEVLPLVDIFAPSYEECLFMLDRDAYTSMVHQANGKNIIDYVTYEDVSRIAETFLCYGAKIVLLKLGYKGMYLRTADEERLLDLGKVCLDPFHWANRELYIPSLHVSTIRSTIGAGDTANAGFLAALLRGETPENALRIASLAAAKRIQSFSTCNSVGKYEDLRMACDQKKPMDPSAFEEGVFIPENELEDIYLGSKDRKRHVN